MNSHRHTILQLPAKFHSNRMIVGWVVTSYPFFWRWRPAAILDLMWVMLDHPQSAIVSISLVFKFGLVRFIGDIAIFILCRFGLKLSIHAHFWCLWGHIINKYGYPSFWPPKGPSLRGNTSFEPWYMKIGPAVRPGCRIEKKGKDRTGQNSQKSHKVVTFRLFGEKLPTAPNKTKFAWWVISPM